MGTKRRTIKGQTIDVQEIVQKNQETIAVGNNNNNARGDELDEFGNIIRPRDQVVRDKNKQKTRNTATASVISSFEDDEDDYVLKDDPNVIKKNQTKTTQRKSEPKEEPKTTKTEPKTETKSSTDETDLD